MKCRRVNHFNRVDEPGQGHRGSSLLVVVPHRDGGFLAQGIKDFETFRFLDVFEIDSAKCRLNLFYKVDDIFCVFRGDAQGERIHATEDLEFISFELHAGPSAVSEAAACQLIGDVGLERPEVVELVVAGIGPVSIITGSTPARANVWNQNGTDSSVRRAASGPQSMGSWSAVSRSLGQGRPVRSVWGTVRLLRSHVLLPALNLAASGKGWAGLDGVDAEVQHGPEMVGTSADLARSGAHRTHWWHRSPDGRVQCDVCPRFCKLHEGQRGLCFVRGRKDDRVVLTTYGRSSGYCIDPIEKKPLNHFLPGTPVLSFGTAGCNLACKFCQNWDISKSREIDTLADAASPETIARPADVFRAGCPKCPAWEAGWARL